MLFLLANVAKKYKNRPRVRISRGAFIWIYEKDSTTKEISLLQPPNAVLDYVLAKHKSKQVLFISFFLGPNSFALSKFLHDLE